MQFRRKHSILALLCLCSAPGAACGEGAHGTGTVAVEIWGEELIEAGIPASEFADDWAITFDAFVVTIGAVSAAGVDFPEAQAFDLTQPGPLPLATLPANAGVIEPVGYSLVPTDGNTRNSNVDSELFDTLVVEGWSVYLRGSATKDGSTITFAWGFDVSVTYLDCHATGTVPANGTGNTQLTIHGDHLFYESLVDHNASLRFGALADADGDGDGDITPAELTAMSGIAFGALDHYDVPAGSGIDNLWDYLTAQVETLGHIDGEGHCDF